VRIIDVIEATIVGVLLVALAVGLGVIVVGIPAFTRYVSEWTGGPELSGLEPETAVETAEAVRAFVMGGDTRTLPAEVAGREGFDAKTVSHLDDVRGVVEGVRTVTGVAAALLAGWATWCLAKARSQALARGLSAGAIVAGVLAGLATLFALLDFDLAFTVFHGIFFEEGTWTFSADSLIIQLFPVAFWASAGAALALWVLSSVGLMVWGAFAVRKAAARGRMTMR
jgi:integral membrane protein (TIGR01906 family)